MTEETNKKEMVNEYVKNSTVEVINTPIVRTFTKDSSKISKIIIPTDKGDITWKPVILREVHVNGFIVEETQAMTFQELPEKLKEIANKVSKDGKCKLEISYTLMKTFNAENEPVEYRFITSDKTLEEWKII